MKLLFDQNLSHRLCAALADVFPGSKQVKEAALEQADDVAIWEFALVGGFVIVTMDADFAEIAGLKGAPPKIVWLRCGNQPTAVVERLLRTSAPQIASFFQDEEAACLEIY